MTPRGGGSGSSDYEFLVSAEARELIEEEGVFVIDYQGVRERWLGRELASDGVDLRPAGPATSRA